MTTVADIIGEKVRKAVADAIHDQRDTLDNIAQDAGENIGTTAIDEMGVGAGGLFGFIGDLPGVGAILHFVDPLSSKVGKLVEGVAVGWALGTALYPSIRAVILPIEHAVQFATTNEIWDPQTVAQLLAKGLIETNHANDEAAGSGFDADHLAHLTSLATTRPDVAMALELLRRGALDDTFVRGELRHLGYATNTVNALMQLQRVLLSPADLALAELRGVITHDEAVAYLPSLGVDENDYATLVGNTGEPPGLEELLFAHRRGFIDTARLVRGIRQSRVRNEWVDVIEKLTHSPMSTADAVRAVIENYLTDDQGKAIAEQNGLMPEHWPYIRESYGRPLAHEQMASLVYRGKASRAQFDQAMRESDIKDKYIDLSFDVAQRLLPERMIVTAIRYKAISLETGSRMLLELGYSKESVSILLKLGLHEQQATAKELTRAQIGSLYADGILTRTQAVDHMTALGYSKQDADYSLQLIDVQAHAKEVKAEVAVIRNNYLVGSITADQAQTEMRQLGLSAVQAQHNIQVWNRERRRAARGLSEAQIVKAAKEATITPQQGITELIALGYSQANAIVLLRSNGVPAA